MLPEAAAQMTFSRLAVPWLAAVGILGLLTRRTSSGEPLDARRACAPYSTFWGDANGDGNINIIDAQQLAQRPRSQSQPKTGTLS